MARYFVGTGEEAKDFKHDFQLVRKENAVATKDFGVVKAGTVYSLLFENGIDSDGEQNVEVYECWTGKYLCRMRASSFSLLSEEE